MFTTRYGKRDVTYGMDGLVYGAAPAVHGIVNGLTWVLQIDWNNDGVFDGSNESGRIFELTVQAGRQNFMKSSGGFQEVDIGEFTASLRNTDGRYDPYNTESPLYGDILPGRRFQLSVYDEFNMVLHPIMKGRLDDIRPIYSSTDDVKISGSNGIKQMKAQQVRTQVFSSIRYDDAILELVANWEDGYDIDTTVSEAMPYWWASGRSLFDEINDVTNAALGMFCIAEDGKATYKSRVSGDAPLFTITGGEIELDYGIRLPMLWEVVKNRIRVYVRNRTQQSNVELWRLAETVFVPAGGSKTIWAQFSFTGEAGVALSVTAPVITTDYLANSLANGSGTNLSSNMSIAMTEFSTTAKFVVSNTGVTGFYITLFKLRGVALVADKYTFAEDTDDESIAEFGDFLLEIKSDWLQDINTAEDEVDILLSRLSNVRKFPRLKLKPLDTNHEKYGMQFSTRLFGLVQLSLPSHNIFDEFRIGYYKHTWRDELGQLVDTEIYLEPNLLENVAGAWVFPAIFGTTTVF